MSILKITLMWPPPKLDPVLHWLERGFREGRELPGWTVRQGDAAREIIYDGWQVFIWHGELVAVREAPKRTQEYPTECPDDASFRAFVRSVLDPDLYFRTYPDSASPGMDPVHHWLEWGMAAGRPLRGWVVVRGPAASWARGAEWQHFIWRNEPISVKRRPTLPESVLRQVLEQGRHEPAVLAPGALAVADLPLLDAPDQVERSGIDISALLGAVRERPRTVLVIPRITLGGGEKYSADLVDVLLALEGGPVLILVSEQSGIDAHEWDELGILPPLRGLPLLFWPDFCVGSSPTFARFLNMPRPQVLVVINSRPGLDAVAQYGLALSHQMRIYCAFFSMGIDGLGASFGTRFPRRTLPYSVALTDNEPMAATLRAQYSGVSGPGIEILPPRAHIATELVFRDRLIARLGAVKAERRPNRWVWISRIEPWKGTAILGALAKLRPDDRFEVFGPVQGSMESLGLALPNLVYRGVLANVINAELGEYSGFVFTSRFEGMPNIVLEVSQHAIPMVLADVGGLRDTFDDNAVIFVKHAPDVNETAAAFAEALDRIAAMSAETLAAIVKAARE